jgi:hypothetical protein
VNCSHLSGWLPIRLYWQGAQAMVDWCYLGERRFAEPFFEQTVVACLQNPFETIFRHQTPVEVLGELYEQRPGIAPSGFVLHMSRCGSTLVSQALAALPDAVVLSEPNPIDQVLRAGLRNPALSDDQRVAWLRWMLSALGQPRVGGESRLFVKFDSWHTLDLPLIARAFPEVPWIFLYREPVEVMVSHQRERGAQMVPGMMLSLLKALGPEALSLSLDAYCARVLREICGAALRYRGLGNDRFVNYSQLPEALWSEILPFFGVARDAAGLDAARRVLGVHAKRPQQPFSHDGAAKRAAATPELHDLAAQWVGPHFQQLEALRLSQPSFSPASKQSLS